MAFCLWPGVTREGPGSVRGAWALTHVAEDDRQEDQAMQQAQRSDEEVETEEEDLDELRLGQAQDEDARQVGHGHSCEHLGVTGGRQAGHGTAGRGLREAAHPLTALPMEMVASLALSSRVGLVLMAKERVMWDTNSTEMPTACGERGGFSHKRAGAGVSTQTSGQHLDSRKNWGRPMRPAPLLPWSPDPSASRLPSPG